jgi:two-component system, chemotaxis family, CheB/CheR fusion protein
MSQKDGDSGFDALLDYLKRARGFDFTGYKRPSLMRRIQKRAQTVGADGFTNYLDYLEVHPNEFLHLFDTILINVTYFFRDEIAWAYLREEIIPRLIASKTPNEPIRIWSAGCASGEEAFSLVISLAEALGEEQFRERVKVYATDADDGALTQARTAIYTAKQVESLPPELLEKYFDKSETQCAFRKDLRRNVIFGRHDLIQDAPISKIDLLVCRNTLMYFNAEAQSKILLHFHFALNENGFLFLGKSEMLLTHSNLFTPVDLKRRVFIKAPKANMRDRLLIMAQSGSEEAAGQLANHVRIREASFDAGPLPQLVVDSNGHMLLANQQARALFAISPRDIGRPLQDLEISYRPTELRSLIEQAYAERRVIIKKDIEWRFGSGDLRHLEAQVLPLVASSGGLTGASVTFADVTQRHQLQLELQRLKQELETAFEEMQSTNEELETTNEELQSTNEELETLNEELHSTNEELETMNEELQSTNEELETINDELRTRTDELNQVNVFLESILTSVRAGVIVLDKDMRVQIWNRKAEDLWGVRSDEAQGQHFLNLDINLDLGQLKQPIRACLAGDSDLQEHVQDTINRRGKKISCKITLAPLRNKAGGPKGAILMMEESDGSRSDGNRSDGNKDDGNVSDGKRSDGSRSNGK